MQCLRSDALHVVPAAGSGLEPTSASFRSLLLLPLRGSTVVEGILVSAFPSADGKLDPFVDHVARTFGTLAALTLERVQAVRSLLEESLRDELTGLGNRRAANRALDRLQPGDAVAIADLDHLKELNDTEGHAAGDELLKAFAAQLASSLREGDVASRLGGDEFLLVLRGVGENAEAIVARLAERWRGTSPIASFSAGVTVSPARATARRRWSEPTPPCTRPSEPDATA